MYYYTQYDRTDSGSTTQVKTVTNNNGICVLEACILEDNSASYNALQVYKPAFEATDNNPLAYAIAGDYGQGGAIFLTTNMQYIYPIAYGAELKSKTKFTKARLDVTNC